MVRLFWKRFGQCSTECGIPLPSRHDGNSQTCPKAWTPSAFLLLAISMRVTLLPTEGSGETLSGLSPLYAVYLPLPLPTHPHPCPVLPCCSPHIHPSSLPPHFNVLCQLTSHLQLHKAFGTTFISLITCVCQLHIWTFTQLLSPRNTRTPWGCGFEAAMTQSRFS